MIDLSHKNCKKTLMWQEQKWQTQSQQESEQQEQRCVFYASESQESQQNNNIFVSLFLVSIVLSFLKKIIRNIYFFYFFFKYEMWWCYSSLLALCLNQLSLMIFIVKNQELYSLFCCSERLKKKEEKKLWERDIYLNVLQTALFCLVNKSNIQSFLSCIWLTFTTFMIHQWIVHIRKNSRIL